jgi:hypothetical protein
LGRAPGAAGFVLAGGPVRRFSKGRGGCLGPSPVQPPGAFGRRGALDRPTAAGCPARRKGPRRPRHAKSKALPRRRRGRLTGANRRAIFPLTDHCEGLAAARGACGASDSVWGGGGMYIREGRGAVEGRLGAASGRGARLGAAQRAAARSARHQPLLGPRGAAPKLGGAFTAELAFVRRRWGGGAHRKQTRSR